MDLVINAIHKISRVHNTRWDIRDEALRLAAHVAPRVGRSGWAERQALDLIAQAECRLIRARFAAAREAEARAKAEKAAREAEAREALEAAGKAAGGFGLKDVNKFYYNCGHYPQWQVVAGGPIPSLAMAQALADKRNARSMSAWQAFLNA